MMCLNDTKKRINTYYKCSMASSNLISRTDSFTSLFYPLNVGGGGCLKSILIQSYSY